MEDTSDEGRRANENGEKGRSQYEQVDQLIS